MKLKLVLGVLLLFGLGGCGETSGEGSADLGIVDSYVTVKNAELFFEVHYGSKWNCEGRGPILEKELRLAFEVGEDLPKEPLYTFVACETVYPTRQAEEAGIRANAYVTYGFPKS